MSYNDRELADRFQRLALQHGMEETADAMGIKRLTLQNWINNGIPQTRMRDVKAWVAERQGI